MDAIHESKNELEQIKIHGHVVAIIEYYPFETTEAAENFYSALEKMMKLAEE